MLLTTTQAAEILGLSTRQVRRLAGLGELRQLAPGVLFAPDVYARAESGHGSGGRPWSAATAWAGIDLVSAGSTGLIPARQRRRLANRVASMDADQFLNAIHAHARTRRFTTDRHTIGLGEGLVVTIEDDSDQAPCLHGYVHSDHLRTLQRRMSLSDDPWGRFAVNLHVTDCIPTLIRTLRERDSLLAHVARSRSLVADERHDALHGVQRALDRFVARRGGK